jgi:hypothetical protein
VKPAKPVKKSVKKSGSSKAKAVKATPKKPKATKDVKNSKPKLAIPTKKLIDKVLKLLDKRWKQQQQSEPEELYVIDGDNSYDFYGDIWGDPYSPERDGGRNMPDDAQPDPIVRYDPPGWSPGLPPGYQEPEPASAATRQVGSLFTGRTHTIDPREVGGGGYLPPGTRSAR